MPAVTARQAAVSALVKVNTQGAYSNLVLNETLKKSGLSPADSSFASRLFYGTLERRLTLDHVINHYSKKPGQQADPGGSGDFADSGLSAFVSGQRAGFRRSKRSGGTDQKDEGGKRVRLCQRGAAKLFAG